MKKILISLMLLSGIYGLTFAQQGSQGSQQSATQGQGSSSKNSQWVKIGEKSLDLSSDRGIFDWNTDRDKTVNANERYSAIKFKAKDAPVSLTNVEVQYDNGKKQDLTVASPIRENSESKSLMLNSTDQLDKITFNFKKDQTAADKANIEVWGLKAGSSGMGMGQSNRSDAGHEKK